MDSLCAAFLCLLVVAGVREFWSFSVGSVLGGVVSSSCPIRDGDVVGVDDVDDVADSFLISDGEVFLSDESGINSLSLSESFYVDISPGSWS